MTRMDG